MSYNWFQSKILIADGTQQSNNLNCTKLGGTLWKWFSTALVAAAIMGSYVL